MFNSLDISSSALQAQRTRLDTIAANIANLNTTRDADGKLNPYRRRFAVFAAGQPGDRKSPGVHVGEIRQDDSPFQKRFQPGHPDAGPDGMVLYPNIDLSGELRHPNNGILFHDGNNRSMEQLTSDLAKNAMTHNLVIELLRKQFAQLDMALKDKVT